MPLYDYRCLACENVSELLVSASTEPACPLCGSARMERLLSTPVTPGRSAALLAGARAQAAREGHFSNYARTERPRGARARR